MPFTTSDLCKIMYVFSILHILSGFLAFASNCSNSIAIFIPPLGVFLERGCNVDFLINICLTILGYLPGIIHALYIIFKY
ncbi:stress response RCI [Pyrrhoderma noxium]|uniref:Stress response RCI n=1 Tax=Pyrrhoderma noxium TaxID=2282107 RepID=A0A286UVU2_9AGAM|nr:stress response RCI [Pyrrhoderma noxium]